MNNHNWEKQFAMIYTGQAFSLLGSAAVQFAVIWWLTIQTESAIVLTLSTIVAFIPNMLIDPFAGPLCEIIGVDTWFFWSGAALVLTGVLCRVLIKPYDKETLRRDAGE